MSGSLGGGNLTALYLMNPELANALRRQQMGQSIAQGGMDASPIRSHWQGLNRVAQGLLGGYLQGQGEDEIKGAYEKNNTALSDAQSRQAAILMGGGAAPAAAPQAPAQPMPPAPTGGGVTPPPDLAPLIANASKTYNVPPNIMPAVFKQESDFGRASPNIGQVTGATAQQPGYGVPPLAPGDINDRAKNIDFSTAYFANKAKALGITDLNDPQQIAAALKAYNGGGDPNYVANVTRYMPGGGAPQQPTGGAPQQAPQTGANAPMVKTGMAMMREGQINSMSFDPRLKEYGRGQIEQAKVLMGLDQFAIDPSNPNIQRNLRTGEVKPVISGTARAFTDANHDSWVMPPGGSAPIKLSSADPPTITRNAAAASQGTSEGALPAKQHEMDLSAETDRIKKMREDVMTGFNTGGQQVRIIDAATKAIEEADKGSLGPNALAKPQLHAVAVAKALGINLAPYGIDADKLGQAQFGNEVLTQLNGEILKRMFPNRTTNMDLQTIGSALTNYNQDIGAVASNLKFYRQNADFDVKKGLDLLKYERNNGHLRGWEDQFYTANGAAPPVQDDLFTNNLRQPQAAPEIPASAASQLKEGVPTTFGNGQVWTMKAGKPVRVK